MSSVNQKGVESDTYSFLLFVVGDEPNSALAKKNLSLICRKHLNGKCKIQIVDVLKDFAMAIKNNIVVTPTLILLKPEPRVTIFGNLSDIEKVLAALHIEGGAN
jgi:circadian clock protein KaiB